MCQIVDLSDTQEFRNRKLNLLTQNATDNRIIVKDAVVLIYNKLIDENFLYKNKAPNIKENGKKTYESNITKLFDRLGKLPEYGTTNLFDVYQFPNRYYRYIYQEKTYLNILYRLFSDNQIICDRNYTDVVDRKVVESIKSICDIKRNIEDISRFQMMYTVIQNMNKEKEQQRMQHAPYYDWNDIKEVVKMIENQYEQNPNGPEALTLLRDICLLRIYVFDNVVRDNLGYLKIYGTININNIEDNFIKKTGNVYAITLNQYKNSVYRGTYTFELSKETSQYIDKYIAKFSQLNSKFQLKYLFPKLDTNEVYQDGKLSSLISDLFFKHGDVRGLGINELRHSVATYAKKFPTAQKVVLANKMQHSLDQHLRYERHSNKILPIPTLEKYINTRVPDPFDGVKVEVRQQNQDKNIVGTVKRIKEKTKQPKKKKTEKRYYIYIPDDDANNNTIEFYKKTNTIPSSNSKSPYFTSEEVETLLFKMQEKERILYQLKPVFNSCYKDVKLKITKMSIHIPHLDVIYKPFEPIASINEFSLQNGGKFSIKYTKQMKLKIKEMKDLTLEGKLFANDESDENVHQFKLVLILKKEEMKTMLLRMTRLCSNDDHLFDPLSSTLRCNKFTKKRFLNEKEKITTKIHKFTEDNASEEGTIKLTMAFDFDPFLKHPNIFLQ